MSGTRAGPRLALAPTPSRLRTDPHHEGCVLRGHNCQRVRERCVMSKRRASPNSATHSQRKLDLVDNATSTPWSLVRAHLQSLQPRSHPQSHGPSYYDADRADASQASLRLHGRAHPSPHPASHTATRSWEAAAARRSSASRLVSSSAEINVARFRASWRRTLTTRRDSAYEVCLHRLTHLVPLLVREQPARICPIPIYSRPIWGVWPNRARTRRVAPELSPPPPTLYSSAG